MMVDFRYLPENESEWVADQSHNVRHTIAQVERVAELSGRLATLSGQAAAGLVQRDLDECLTASKRLTERANALCERVGHRRPHGEQTASDADATYRLMREVVGGFREDAARFKDAKGTVNLAASIAAHAFIARRLDRERDAVLFNFYANAVTRLSGTLTMISEAAAKLLLPGALLPVGVYHVTVIDLHRTAASLAHYYTDLARQFGRGDQVG